MAVTSALVVVLILSAARGIERNPKWARKVSDVLKSRDDVIKSFRKLSDETKPENIEELLEKLQDFPSQLTGIDRLDLDAPEFDRAEFHNLLDQPEKPIVSESFPNKNLESNYTTRGLGFMLKSNEGYQSLRCLIKLYSPPQTFKGYKLPMKEMCRYVKEDIDKPKIQGISTDKICKGTDTCSGEGTPYPYGDKNGASVKNACTKDNMCDVEKALPMMGALLWYKVSAFVAKSLCSNYLNKPDEATLNREHEDISNMAYHITLYASTLQWKDFFHKAIKVRAYSDLPAAMELVKEREKSIERTAAACIVLKSAKMCTIGDIYKEYQSLLKLKKDHSTPPKTRNLRRYANVDSVKILDLKTEALTKITLLGEIRSLDENLQTAVTGISKYFRGLAEYDQGIAQADVTFLSDKLKGFKTKSEALAKKADQEIQKTLKIALTATSLQLLEETGLLALKIAENLNPLRVIFGGVEPGDIYEQTGKVAAALAKETRAIALAARFSDVWKDSLLLMQDFYKNAAQISNLYKLVTDIESNTNLDKIDFDSAKFIKEYGDYTPKVARSRLAKNDALWSAYKDSACDLLFSGEGALSSVPQGVAGGMLLCENLGGTLSELAALRENIFDFQFDLVDALARVVRGIVAKTLAGSIKVSNDLLEASQLMLGFFIIQYRLQSQASLYCDKLEYRKQGHRVKACSRPPNGFFSLKRIQDMSSCTAGASNKDERFVYIPTKPQFQGDNGFVDLQELAKGKSVTFQLPANRSWLEQYNWLDPGLSKAPFVENFKLYLPRKTYPTESKKEYSKTHISLKSIASSFVSVESEVPYYLPLDDGVFETFYGEGYSRCAQKEIPNPYSLCNNLPDICDTTQRETGTSLLPTILSTWQLDYRVYSGRTTLKWNAPDPATNLLLIAKVILAFPVRAKNNPRSLSSPQIEGQPVSGCCKSGNEYRPEWNRGTCKPCPSRPTSPTDAKSNLGGYYCEKGNEPVAKV